MSFTVTASATSGQDSVVLKVWVVTGATESGGAATTGEIFFAPPAEFPLTPNFSGSVIVAGLNNVSNAAETWTPAASNTTDNSGSTASGAYWYGHYTGTVTAGTGVTLGCTDTGNDYVFAAYEVPASGTPAIDASTPAAVAGSTASATTSSFTPPSGAVLAAVITADGSASQTVTMSDTSGLGLTWTQRGSTFTGGFSGTAIIFTTTIPGGGGGGGGTPAPVRQARAGKTWRRKFDHRQSLPLPPPPNVRVTAGRATAAALAQQPVFGRYITGIHHDATLGGWFTDNTGQPRLWVATETWGLPVNAGQWSGSTGGTYQQDFDNFFAARAAQGFTVIMTDPVWGPTSNGAHSGNTWDGLTPLTGGTTNPTGATLNSSYWARIDYMLTSAANNGITVALVPYNGDDQATGLFTNGWTTTQWQDWGALLGARYKNTPNLVWLFGNDAFSPFADSQWDALLAGIQGAGDTHMVAPWYNAECTSRYITDTSTSEPWGVTNTAFNFCYSYNAEYWIIEYAYLEVASEGAASLLPVILGDGYFYQGGSTYSSTDDRALRQQWWWALASGARGTLGESENVYPWSTSAAVTNVTAEWFFANNAANIVTAFTGLAGWHQLVPDTGNALVTAGRGTRVTGFTSGGSGGQYEPAFTNSYVAASRTPDSGSGSSLAVLYLPNHTTITIDQTKIVTGYTATWVDPVSGATSSATAGSTYNSTAKGSNSQGDPDWVLILQASTGTTAAAGLATGTGTAQTPSIAVTANAVLATGAAAAQAPSAAITANARLATGTGAAQQPTVTVTPNAQLATGTGAAKPPVPAITVPASVATGTGAALNATAAGSGTANAQLATGTGAAPSPAITITANATLATATAAALSATIAGAPYRLMDGVAGRPGVGSTGTQPPTSPNAYSGNFQAGLIFAVTQGGMWFGGYWWWVPAGGDTGAQKFCLYQVNGGTTTTLLPAATVTSGTLTAGAWNYISLTTPIQLSPGATGNNSGGLYIATTAWTAVNGFPITANQFDTSQPYASGITNGPLTTFGVPTGGHGFGDGSTFGTATNDPATACPIGNDGARSNFWLDVQVASAPPAGYTGSYRLWPNRGDASYSSTADSSVDYVIATEIALAQECALNAVWYYSPPGTAQLATRAGVYSITGADAGTEVAAITSPSWSGAAASGWIKATFPAGTILPAGKYKVYVYNDTATPDGWGTKDALTDYWQTGEGANGITWGPVSAPNLGNASLAYNYNGSLPGSTPPYTDGTILAGQSTFAIGGSGVPIQYPYLYAPVGAGSNQTQNYWVDLEVTPSVPAGLATGTGTALNATVAITASSTLATGTGTAQASAAAITVTAGLATAAAAALSATIAGSGAANAAAATAAGTARSPAVAITTPSLAAAATGTAQTPVPQVTATAALATATGTALQPSIQASGSTTANAGLATGTGTAQQPTAQVTALPQLATATGTALNGQRIIPATLATATGTAQTPALTALAQAQAATALATALNATGHIVAPFTVAILTTTTTGSGSTGTASATTPTATLTTTTGP